VSDTRDPSHLRTTRWLEGVCLSFVGLGVCLPIAYASAPFALYRSAIADAIGDASLVDGPTARLAVGIIGGSIAGKWLAHWAVVRFGVRERQRWALRATVFGLLAWFVVDSLSSLIAGAWANVVMVNLLPLVLVLPLVARLRRSCGEAAPPSDPQQAGPARLSFATALVGIASGLAIAFAMGTPLFARWWDALGDAQFGGQAPSEGARAIVRFFAGPIGGSTAGHFVLLAFVARHAIRAGERWAPRWSLLSILAWAVTDSAWSVSAGGIFNVLLVNVPCAVLLTPPLVWSIAKSRAPAP
jgi:hypothetical protein